MTPARDIDPMTVPDHLVTRYQPGELLALLGALALAEVDRVATRRNRRGRTVSAPQATATAYEAARRAIQAIGGPDHLAHALAQWVILEARHHETGTPRRLG